MSFVFPTNASQVQAFAGALFGVQAGSATMAQVNADILANGGLIPTLNGYYSATQSSTANAASAVAKNLGLTGAALTEGTAYITAQLNAAAPGARGAVISNIANMFGTYTTDATFGAAATAWNTKLAAAVAYTGATNEAIGAANPPVTVAAGIFTLTTNADLLSPSTTVAQNKTGAGNDTIYAVDNGSLTSADIIDGGDGLDVIIASATANSQTLAPVLTSVDTVTITHTAADTKTFTFNAANTTGLTLVNIKGGGAVSDNAGDETITVSGLAKTTSLGIIGGIASTAATGAVLAATFTGAAAADTQKVEISAAGKATSLTLSTAETVQITATGNGSSGANILGTLAATAVKTLNIVGTGDLTIGASDLAAAPTINASTTTGVIAFTGETAATTTTFTGGSGNTTVSTASTGVVKVTTGAGADVVDFLTAANTATVSTGAGNDEVRVGAQAQVTSADSIDGGDGTDTITVTDGTINGTTRTTLATGIKNFEVVQTAATTGVIVDFNALSTYKTVSATGADAGVTAANAAAAAAQGTAGAASVALTTINDSTFNVSASRVGQAGQAVVADNAATTGGAGGAGISIVPNLDNGSNVATLKVIGGLTFTGGAGGAADGANDTTGAGGSAINASNIEVLNLDISGTNTASVGAATVTLTAGAAGALANGAAAGAAGSGLVVGTNATVNITSSLTGATAAANNNLTLGTVVGTNVTINASTFAGKLSVTAASGNVTITGGSGADSLTAGAGNDTISGGAGADVITGGAAGDILSGGAGRDSFTIGTAGHSAKTTTTGNVTFDKISDFGKVTISATAAQVTAMNNVAAFQATATAQGGAEADMLDLAATATLAAAATGTDVAAAVTTNPAVTGTISAKGIVTVAGAGASLVDTLAEWIAVAKIMTANANVAAFEFGGNTYVYQEEANNDDVIELTGVTGVTGIVLVGGTGAAAVGDIFVI